jgi:hypothetical protein
MDLTWLLACLPGALIWLAVLLLPWRPWSTRERLQPSNPGRDLKPGELTVLIPARNEAAQIGRTLNALRDQIGESQVVLVDDQSDDGTAEVARNLGVDGLEIVDGVPMPAGWTGKLWALHQGLERVTTPRVLLLDADIEVGDGVVSTLLGKMDDDGLQMASVMARLSTSGWWEKLLLPAFVYFFKLLYPFRLANDPRRRTAAAAGGCVLLETEVLRSIGGFTALKNELIDDCALAARIKDAGPDLGGPQQRGRQPPPLWWSPTDLGDGGAYRLHSAPLFAPLAGGLRTASCCGLLPARRRSGVAFNRGPDRVVDGVRGDDGRLSADAPLLQAVTTVGTADAVDRYALPRDDHRFSGALSPGPPFCLARSRVFDLACKSHQVCDRSRKLVRFAG